VAAVLASAKPARYAGITVSFMIRTIRAARPLKAKRW
jgi:hypothetical protein